MVGLSDDIQNADLVIVGSGFFGSTVAEQAASLFGKKVVVLESRNHIGGNAYSFIDSSSGIEVHKYGSHLFHTSNKKVWDYINGFTSFNNYIHKVVAISDDKVYTLPFNLHTLAEVYGHHFSPLNSRNKFKLNENNNEGFENLEEKAISMVGPEIYQKLVKGYTEKQWQMDPRMLPGSIIKRLPVRDNFNSDYFDDIYQGLPVIGYGKLFEKILDNPLISVHLETDFFKVEKLINSLVVYTGPIDKFFGYKYGELGWRTLDFEFEEVECENYQGNSVINYPDTNVPYTRIHEFKYLHPERPPVPTTIIAREYSRVASSEDEPYYPVNSPSDRSNLLKYRELAKKLPNIFFGGRLGTYQYLDMHMAIASALNLVETKLSEIWRVK
jgi:UDP-galactopyranose mutase